MLHMSGLLNQWITAIAIILNLLVMSIRKAFYFSVHSFFVCLNFPH